MNIFSIMKTGVIKVKNVECYKGNDIELFIDGMIFRYGKRCGEETIEWLLELLTRKKKIPFHELHGAFTCAIKIDKKTVVFTDNSNMHCAYYSDDVISNSYLKVIEVEARAGKKVEFGLDAICEYITIGNIYNNKTFFKDIHLLDSRQVAVIENGEISIHDKGIGDIDEKSTIISLNDFFDKLSYSISEQHVCQALTGGYDSRLVYACLSAKIEDHAAISANITKHADVEYARKVAEANHAELDIIPVNRPAIDEGTFFEVLKESDGMIPLDIDAYMRLRAFKRKLSESYNFHLTGDGGVLHKDWEWMQDLPFYKKRKSNPRKFYRQRLFYINNSDHIGEKLRKAYMMQEERFISCLNKIKKKYNTQSYDSWYYYISGNRQVYYNCNPIENFISYAPLMELDTVRYSYSLPRFKRFFYNSMRKTISKENIKVARVITNYGTTASSEWKYLVRDVFFQVIDYIKKGCRLLGRRLLKKSLFIESIIDWSLENEVRNSKYAYKALEYSVKEGYIKEDVLQKDLSYSELQRIIHIYFLHDYVEKEKNFNSVSLICPGNGCWSGSNDKSSRFSCF